jgi:hypothetical protein
MKFSIPNTSKQNLITSNTGIYQKKKIVAFRSFFGMIPLADYVPFSRSYFQEDLMTTELGNLMV